MKLEIQTKKTWFALMVTVLILPLLFLVSISNSANASTIAETVSSTIAIQPGVAVSLRENDTSKIEFANVYNQARFMGFIVEQDNATLVAKKDFGETTVALSGDVQVLVSTLNGEAKQGDILSLSTLNGVLMRSDEGSVNRSVAIALEDFSNVGAKSYEVEGADGRKDETTVNYLKVRIFDSGVANDLDKTPETFGLVEKLVGKEVDPIRLIAGLVLFVASLVMASMFIFSSVRASFISFGRNPLASNSIYTGLIQVSTISVTIIIIGAALTYLVWVV